MFYLVEVSHNIEPTLKGLGWKEAHTPEWKDGEELGGICSNCQGYNKYSRQIF